VVPQRKTPAAIIDYHFAMVSHHRDAVNAGADDTLSGDFMLDSHRD
jgi:hypothetical protein